MAKPCRQFITEAALAVLSEVAAQESAGGAVKGVKVEMNRRVPLAAEDLPAIVLLEGNGTPANDFSSEDGYTLPFVVQGAILGSGPDATERANTLRAEIEKALLANRTLGLPVRFLELIDDGDWIGIDIDAAETEGFLLAFHVGYATREGDPFTFEP